MTPSSISTNAMTKPSLRTSPLPIWSSISKPNPKSSAPASRKKPLATNPTSPPNTSTKSLAPTNTSSSATPPPTFWSSTPRTLISSSAATTFSSSSAASRNPSKALSISSPLVPPNSSHTSSRCAVHGDLSTDARVPTGPPSATPLHCLSLNVTVETPSGARQNHALLVSPPPPPNPTATPPR